MHTSRYMYNYVCACLLIPRVKIGTIMHDRTLMLCKTPVQAHSLCPPSSFKPALQSLTSRVQLAW
jgi:hypothetical protein